MAKRRQRAVRRLISLLAAVLLQAGMGLPAFAQEVHRFDIDAPDAAQAIQAFAHQASVQLLASADALEGKRLGAVRGELSTDEGLARLLLNTGLGYRYVGERAVAIVDGRNGGSMAAALAQESHGAAGSTGDRDASSNGDVAKSVQGDSAASESTAQGANQPPQASTGDRNSQTTRLEAIMVTAQKRTQRLQDVPLSISAFTSLSIEKNMIDDLTDYFNKSPNVSYIESGSRSKRSISIRGVSDIGGSANSIAVYVDEFGISNGPATINDDNINSSLNPQLQDIERIEVLRGPQGTFFGRNAAAGAINITTKKPQPDFYAEGTAGFGSFDSWMLSGVVNTPIVADKFLLRASAYVSQSDGFVKNVDPAGGRSDSEYESFRVAGRYMPHERLTVDLVAAYTQENQGLDNSVSTGVPNRSSTQLLGFLGLTEAVLDGLEAYPTNTTRVSHNNPLDQESVFSTLVGRIQYDLSALSIVSVTGLLDTAHDLTGDVDLTSFDFLNQSADVDTDTFSQELRLQSNGDRKFDWVIGGLYARDENIQRFLAHAGADSFLGLPEGFLFSDGRIETTITSYGLFGQATWHATERLSLTLGGRYSNDKVERVDDRISFEVQRPIISGGKSFSDVSPRFAASYALTDHVTTYFTAAKGYKAGGVQTNPESDLLPLTDFAKETLWSFEAGVKAELLDGRLRANGSVFYYDWSDLQVRTGVNFPDPNNPTNILFIQFTDNAASASNKGVELEFTALAAPGLEIGGGVGYSDAKYEEFSDAVIFGQFYELSGRRLPRAPKWTLNADTQYNFAIGASLNAYVRAEWNYRDQTIPVFDATIESGFPYRTPSFDVWNFRAGVQSDRFSLVAYVENALNEQYFTSLDPTFGFSGLQVHPSKRQFGVRLTLYTN